MFAAVVPLLFIAAAVALLTAPSGGQETDRSGLRDALLGAGLLLGLWVAVGTELLSLGHALSFWPVLALWGVPLLGMSVWLAANARRVGGAVRGCLADSWGRPGVLGWAFIAGAAAILLVVGMVAAITPPNNWDAQGYHLPRQIYWIQQGGVQNYATTSLRQLMMPPLAEFAGAHLMILSGGDGWINLIQWSALGLTAVAVSLIARELGAGARGQALAALLAVSNPMAIVQACNAKNDLVVSFFACAAAYYGLRVWPRRRCGVADGALVGVSLGLMVLTKGTGLILAVPLAGGAGLAMLAVGRWRCVRAGVVAAACAIALNAGHWTRNFVDFGSPTGPAPAEGGYPLANETVGWQVVVSNVVRNLALHAVTPSNDVNAWIIERIGDLHRAIGLDPSDPATTYMETKFTLHWLPYHEDQTSAPVHLVLAVVLLPPLLWTLRRRERWGVAVYALAAYGSFVLFCAALRWQPWHSRLHLPIVCLFAPCAAWAIAGPRARPVAFVTAAAALAMAVPVVLWNSAKPLLGERSIFRISRVEQMYLRQPALRKHAEGAVETIRGLGAQTIGFAVGSSAWEYPIQRRLLDTMQVRPRFVGFFDHPTRRNPGPFEVPDVVVVSGDPGPVCVHEATGTPMAFIERRGQYRVAARLEIAERAGLWPPSETFFGFEALEGLDDKEGPYPRWDLPIVRWGVGPKTALRIEGYPWLSELVLECRRNNTPDQVMVIRFNGEEVHRHVFGRAYEFQTIRLPLRTVEGDNTLEFEYATQAGPRSSAVLFRRLTVLPRDPEPPAISDGAAPGE